MQAIKQHFHVVLYQVTIQSTWLELLNSWVRSLCVWLFKKSCSTFARCYLLCWQACSLCPLLAFNNSPFCRFSVTLWILSRSTSHQMVWWWSAWNLPSSRNTSWTSPAWEHWNHYSPWFIKESEMCFSTINNIPTFQWRYANACLKGNLACWGKLTPSC